MNWSRALNSLKANDDAREANALSAALALDTVYMPSDLAARLLPLEVCWPKMSFTRDRGQPDADRLAPAR